MTRVTAVVDGHVHIHACYDLDAFFYHAFQNLSVAARGTADPQAFFLLMTECDGDDFFGRLRSSDMKPKRWKVAPTAETESLLASDGQRRIFVVAGRQIACREGLEVLMMGTTGRFKDRRPIREVLDEATSLGVPHVIPWGAGK